MVADTAQRALVHVAANVAYYCDEVVRAVAWETAYTDEKKVVRAWAFHSSCRDAVVAVENQEASCRAQNVHLVVAAMISEVVVVAAASAGVVVVPVPSVA